MNNKFINYVTFLIESKNDVKQVTRLKLNGIIYISVFALLVFFISFFAYWFNSLELIEVKEKRDEYLVEMMRANMGEVPKRPSEVRNIMANEIDFILEGNNDDKDTLKNKISKYLEPFQQPEKSIMDQISKKIKENKSANYQSFFEHEKVKLTEEIQKIDSEILTEEKLNKAKIQDLDSFFYHKFNKAVNDNKNIVPIDKDYIVIINIEGNNKKIVVTKAGSDRTPVDTFDLLDFQNISIDPNVKFNDGEPSEKKIIFKRLLEKKSQYDTKIIEIVENEKKINDLKNLKEAKYKNQVSLDTYRKNKAYIIQNQYNISNQSLEYCLNKGIKYFAFYQALIIVILVFTALIGLCIFAISTKGWSGSDSILKTISITVIVILGTANLINVVMKPKENYSSYIRKAEKNEAVQADIIKFFNRYDKLNEAQIDTLINRNFRNITKFSEILPETNEAGLKEGFQGFNDLSID